MERNIDVYISSARILTFNKVKNLVGYNIIIAYIKTCKLSYNACYACRYCILQLAYLTLEYLSLINYKRGNNIIMALLCSCIILDNIKIML